MGSTKAGSLLVQQFVLALPFSLHGAMQACVVRTYWLNSYCVHTLCGAWYSFYVAIWTCLLQMSCSLKSYNYTMGIVVNDNPQSTNARKLKFLNHYTEYCRFFCDNKPVQVVRHIAKSAPLVEIFIILHNMCPQ